jgi:hypothetical protein
MPVISATLEVEEEDCEFEASPGKGSSNMSQKQK